MSMHEMEKQSLHLDKTINVGQILTIIGLLTAGLAGFYAVRESTTLNATRIAILERSIQEDRAQARQMVESLQGIRQDMAVIRYRLEKDGKAVDRLP